MLESRLQVELKPEHKAFAQFVGEWSGLSKTFLTPVSPPEIGEITSRFQTVLGGLFLTEEYEGRIGSRYHKGFRTYGYDDELDCYTCVWIDSFHTGPSTLVFAGRDEEGHLAFSGEYLCDHQQWRWKFIVDIKDSNKLRILHYNCSPEGSEEIAIDLEYRRIGPVR